MGVDNEVNNFVESGSTLLAMRNFTPSIFFSVALATSTLGAEHRSVILSIGGRDLKVEVNCKPQYVTSPPTVVFLHGAGGPNSPNLPFIAARTALERKGYCTYVPHYLEASETIDARKGDALSLSWVPIIEGLLHWLSISSGVPLNRVVLVGYSSGASLALAVAAKNPGLAAVVDVSGNLPDEYVGATQVLPPLLIIHGQIDGIVPINDAHQLYRLCRMIESVCVLRAYPEEGHVFSLGARRDLANVLVDFVKQRLPVENRGG
jgi:predicted esterase